MASVLEGGPRAGLTRGRRRTIGARWACLLLAFALGCEREEPPARCGDDVGARSSAASAVDRRLLGVAVDHGGDPTLEARWLELARSQRARRRVAWEVVARVLAPTPLGEPTVLGEASVPRFRAFYDREDFGRLFQRLYGALSPEARAARARPSSDDVDAAFLWNVGFLDELGTWPDERWREHLATLDSREALNAVGGVRRITMSPALTRHVVESYPEILACLERGAPPAELAGEPRTDRIMRRALSIAACGRAHVGPFELVRGGSLRVRFEAAAGEARLVVAEGASADDAVVVCEGVDCRVEGPAVVHVRVEAGATGAEGALDVERTQVAPPVACLRGALPIDAVSVAAEWRRLDSATPLPVYDTSARTLAALMREPTPTWGEGERGAHPAPDAIYTQRLPAGATFVLAGFHVRTRELPLGLNVTLWWSDTPDEDFGADRPDAIRALGPPWSSYKMCVVVDHDELDGDPGGGFGDDAPTLAAALAALHEGRGGPTWCSNPYVDAAPGLARANCVGCHQHAMSGARPGEVATDEARFPANGRLAARNNYPSDGFWGLDSGDDLAGAIRDVVDHWR
ncbi:MAG: hypothetical protein KF901_07055 [Myxococcales bacterium]|nr:hypothetical protein [Myxococcales bacterium]